ncbi:hypothetical protein [uncultured Hymenobacter sp.]|uniref:hypothetical protein n=1 Tax=uncultured Hymenobacter sp. TaxID=170016 RepID=UPI0035CB922E
MDNKDLPLVMAEMLIEMQQLNTRVTRLEDAMVGVQGEISSLRIEARENTDRLIDALTKNTGVMIERLMRHDDQLRDHDGRLSNLENPPR